MANVNVRFVGVPAPVLREIVSLEPGWRTIGMRMYERAVETCPESKDLEGDYQGPHLKDTLVVHFVTGTDPRILIGSEKKGQVLSWVTDGTTPHEIVPVNARALRWTVPGGTVVFAQHVNHPGTKPNPFLLDAVRAIAQETTIAV